MYKCMYVCREFHTKTELHSLIGRKDSIKQKNLPVHPQLNIVRHPLGYFAAGIRNVTTLNTHA
jgi:hypothetical protein